MKLLLVTSLKDYQKRIVDIMNLAGIDVFSVSDTVGFKDQHKPVLMDSWFSSGGEQAESIFLFSFTDDASTERALNLINQYNTENESGFPIRAFVLPVEKSTYDLK